MKISIELGRSATINCGNYNTIKPSVSIRIDDVDENQVISKKDILADLMDALFANEFIALSEEINSINDVGFQNYSRALLGQHEIIKEKIDNLYEKLMK